MTAEHTPQPAPESGRDWETPPDIPDPVVVDGTREQRSHDMKDQLADWIIEHPTSPTIPGPPLPRTGALVTDGLPREPNVGADAGFTSAPDPTSPAAQMAVLPATGLEDVSPGIAITGTLSLAAGILLVYVSRRRQVTS